MGEGLIATLLAAVATGRAGVLATVVATDRSVPRRPGSKMVVWNDGSTTGTIGGGAMEANVVAEALVVLAKRSTRLLTYNLVDPGAGDPGVCGGAVTIYLEAYLPTETVYVIGCGHVGKSVVELAHWLGFRVVAFDDRADLVTADALPLADIRVTGTIADAQLVAPITSETHVVLVTRNVAVDLQLLPELIASPARSIGVMGSKRRWETTRAQLSAMGVGAAELDRIRTPIGLELGAETPEEIAVSILAEIVQLRRTQQSSD
jgi:xanthine dehydrogenase accessory factor